MKKIKNIGFYNPAFYQILFVCILIAASFAYYYPQTIKMRPYSLHQWRQCDCLSIADNYYEENRSFLNPSVHWTGPAGNGNTISEFPIIYYSVAKLWQLFGKHEFIFRLINLLFLFTSLVLLFKLFEDILKHSIWSILIVTLFFTSPILVYYGNTFMADVPALSISIMGWFFFWKYYKTNKNVLLIISMLLFCLAILLKASSAISYFAILLLFFLEFINLIKLRKEEKLFSKSVSEIVIILIPIIISFAWYSFASQHNKANNYGLFLIGTLPIWKIEYSEINLVLRALIHDTFPQFFNSFGLIILLLLGTTITLFWKKTNPLLTIVFFSMLLAFVTFLILFFQVFKEHDYYLINMLIIIPLLLLTFFLLIKKHFYSIYNSKKSISIFSFFIIISIYNTSVIQKAKYFRFDKKMNYSALLSQKQVDYLEWFHWDYDNHYKALETITPYLRSIGIKRDDKVFSVPDKSINITLYLMNQKGWTEYGYNEYEETPEKFMEYIAQNGAKYLIINDENYLNQEYLKPYIKNKIGQYQNVQIFSFSK